MDLRRLALLRELSRRGSVTAVAAEAHVTPTAVSQQLRLLEREAGAVLLRRVGRGIELTDAGRELAEASLGLAAAQEDLLARWQRYRGDVTGTIRVAMFPTAGQRFVAPFLARLDAHPGVQAQILDLDVASDRYADHADDVDVVVAHRPHDEPSPAQGYTVVPLTREPLDVAVGPTHHLAGRHQVRPADVAEEPWVGVPPDWPFDRLLLQWFAGSGRQPRVVQRFSDLRMQEALVAAGRAVALVPRHSVDHRDGARLRLLRTTDGSPTRRVEAIMRPDRAARAVVAVAVDALRAVTAAPDAAAT